MRVALVPGQKPDYVRNSILVKGLQKNDVEVIQCGVTANSYPIRIARSILNYISSKSAKRLDAILVGFYGQPIVPIIRMMTKLPIVFDAFISTYDTLCFERRLFRSDSPLGRLSYFLDKKSCEESNLVLLDTEKHIEYFVETFNLDRHRFAMVPVGVDDEVFHPLGLKHCDDRYVVFFHGTYRPAQGIDIIIDAARRLAGCKDIVFRIVGNGSGKKRIMEWARRLELRNVEFLDWIPYDELPHYIEMSDVCLGGHFSPIEKAKRVVAGKTFQYLAMRKPTIVGNNPANQELFQAGKNVLMVDHGDSAALADAILSLKNNPSLSDEIANAGFELIQKKYTAYIIGSKLKELIEKQL